MVLSLKEQLIRHIIIAASSPGEAIHIIIAASSPGALHFVAKGGEIGTGRRFGKETRYNNRTTPHAHGRARGNS